jgi:hypothetical protein
VFVGLFDIVADMLQIMEPHKHLELKWMDWQELWLELWAVDKRGEYFQSLVNMFDRYPMRANLVRVFDRSARV